MENIAKAKIGIIYMYTSIICIYDIIMLYKSMTCSSPAFFAMFQGDPPQKWTYFNFQHAKKLLFFHAKAQIKNKLLRVSMNPAGILFHLAVLTTASFWIPVRREVQSWCGKTIPFILTKDSNLTHLPVDM